MRPCYSMGMSSSLPRQVLFLAPDTFIRLSEYAQRRGCRITDTLRTAMLHALVNSAESSAWAAPTGRTERVAVHLLQDLKDSIIRLSFEQRRPMSEIVAASVENWLSAVLAEEAGLGTSPELARTWAVLDRAHETANRASTASQHA